MFNPAINNDFWDIYGTRIKVYALLTIVILCGTQYWRHHVNYNNKVAAQKFQMALLAMSMHDVVTAKNHSQEVLSYSGSTPYPKLAALMLAKILIEENKLPDAINTLRAVVDKQATDNIWHLANLRLIKALLLAGKTEEAEVYINKGIKDKKFASLYHERQGDMFVANQELTKANKAYALAATELPGQVHSAWLDLKIADTNISGDDRDAGDKIANNNF